MNLEGIQTIRIMQTVLDVLLNFRVKNVSIDIGCNFSRDPPQYWQKSLQIFVDVVSTDRQRHSVAVLS